MQPQLDATLDARQVRNALKALKELDADSRKKLNADFRTKINPVANQIAQSVPIQPPLSGFGTAGRTGWGAVKGKVSFTPGRSRRTANHLVSIKVSQIDGRAGLNIAELKWGSTGRTAAGQNMTAVLNQRFPTEGLGGRFVYKKFRMLRPDLVNMAKRALSTAFSKLEKNL